MKLVLPWRGRETKRELNTPMFEVNTESEILKMFDGSIWILSQKGLSGIGNTSFC